MKIMKLYLVFLVTAFLASNAYGDINSSNCSSDAVLLTEAGNNIFPRALRERTGNAEAAIKLYLMALENSPDCRTTLRLITRLYSELHQIDLAKVYLKKLLEVYPDDSVGLQIQSDIFVHEGDFENAIQIRKNIIKKNGGENGYNYYSIARIYALLNDVDLSLEYLQRAIKISPKWGDNANAQADDAFIKVIKDERFKNIEIIKIK